MGQKKLTGFEKAAILLMAVGEDVAGQVLKSLDPREIRLISQAMGNMVNIATEDQTAVMDEFNKVATSLGVTISGKEFLTKVLNSALGSEKARQILESISASENKALDALKWMDAQTIAAMLRDEHPQTCAVMLTHAEADQAAAALSLLPEEKRNDVAYRMATSLNVPPSVLEELGWALQEELMVAGSTRAVTLGGPEWVAGVLNSMGRDVEGLIMNSIQEKNQELADQIRAKMFVFEDLMELDDRGMQELLREVSKEDLLLALKGAPEEVKEKFFKNMSSRAAHSLKEDMEVKGPVKVSEVERSQQNILKLARRLEGEGRIVLGEQGAEQMV